MDGHHFDQLLVAFQAQDLFFTGLPRQRQMLGQMTDQRLLAIQFRGGLLQQFTEVQQVGQHPLAITAGDEGLRQLEVVEQATQHRQHALGTPDGTVATELHHP